MPARANIQRPTLADRTVLSVQPLRVKWPHANAPFGLPELELPPLPVGPSALRQTVVTLVSQLNHETSQPYGRWPHSRRWPPSRTEEDQMNPKKQKEKDRRRGRKLAEQAWDAAHAGVAPITAGTRLVLGVPFHEYR